MPTVIGANRDEFIKQEMARKAGRRFDPGELNIPNRLGNIDRELDKYKAEQANLAKAKDKERHEARKKEREENPKPEKVISDKPKLTYEQKRQAMEEKMRKESLKKANIAHKKHLSEGMTPEQSHSKLGRMFNLSNADMQTILPNKSE